MVIVGREGLRGVTGREWVWYQARTIVRYSPRLAVR